LGDEPPVTLATALSVEGIRHLRTLVGSLKPPPRSRSGAKTRK
jgi:hypothetical protein